MLKHLRRKIAVLIAVGTCAISCCNLQDDFSAGSKIVNAPGLQFEPQKEKKRMLIVAAYTVPREVYRKKIIPAFKKFWKMRTGEDIDIRESYLGSGIQSRSIAAGFEADIAALSREVDIERLVQAGLIPEDWKSGPNNGVVTRSAVVLGVRKGNPLNVVTWDDLAVPGRTIITPDIKSSVVAMWNIAALYGASLRGHTSAVAADETSAAAFLSRVLANVETMKEDVRESMQTFAKGEGDVIITFENEMRAAAAAGIDNEYIVPPSTILIENPIAVVNKYAEAHGVEDVANAFISFVLQTEIQTEFAKYGLRPANDSIAETALKDYPQLKDHFTVRDLGDWDGLAPKLFGHGGIYDRAMAAALAPKQLEPQNSISPIPLTQECMQLACR